MSHYAQSGDFEQVPHWVLMEASANALRLYLLLRRYAMGKGVCWPSRPTLAAEMRVSVDTLDRAKNELLAMGALAMRARATADGGQTSNEYTVWWWRHGVNPAEGGPHVRGGGAATVPLAPPQTGDTKHTQEHTQASKDSRAAEPHAPSTDVALPAAAAPVPRAAVSPVQATTSEGGPHTRTPARSRRSVPTAAVFDRFWATYPRRVGKKEAIKVFTKACAGVSPEVIIAGAQRYADDPNREPEFTAHPSTWLNQGRWDDDPLPARGSSGPKTGGERRMGAYQDLYDKVTGNERRGIGA